ncbi:MAG: hypothetical protein HY235_17375 [Acidobacteria bacterium]|nr:hypothetical protein [Acidobacteriota bacterium]
MRYRLALAAAVLVAGCGQRGPAPVRLAVGGQAQLALVVSPAATRRIGSIGDLKGAVIGVTAPS